MAAGYLMGTRGGMGQNRIRGFAYDGTSATSVNAYGLGVVPTTKQSRQLAVGQFIDSGTVFCPCGVLLDTVDGDSGTIAHVQLFYDPVKVRAGSATIDAGAILVFDSTTGYVGTDTTWKNATTASILLSRFRLLALEGANPSQYFEAIPIGYNTSRK